MTADRVAPAAEDEPPTPLGEDTARLALIDRQQRMSLEQRLELFECLSRDAGWVRSSARRVR